MKPSKHVPLVGSGMGEGGGQSRQHGASGHPGVSHVASYLRSRIPIADETKLRRQLAGVCSGVGADTCILAEIPTCKACAVG